MGLETVLSVIGSIASIGGAIWALVEARKSAHSATKAQRLRDELVHRREIVEVSQVHVETKRILATVSKIGPACDPEILRGINCVEIAHQVEEYVRFIVEQSSHFDDFFENKANELSDDLKDDIVMLSEAKNSLEKKEYGKSIYYKIQNFMPAAKQLSDEKKEKVTKL